MDPLRRKLFGDGIAQLKSTYDVCLFPGEQCSAKAIRAHSIQNGRILEQLSLHGHVVVPRLQIREGGAPEVAFEKIGRRNATTFTGLCGRHDSLLFRPIEENEIDRRDPQHLFLLAYRALLRECHASRKAAVDLQTNYKRGASMGVWPSDSPSEAGMLAVEKMVAAFMIECVKAEYDLAYVSADWRRLDHWVVRLGVGPTVAVSSFLSTGLYSSQTDQAAFVALSVIPVDRETIAIFSFLRECRPQVRKAYSSIMNGPRRNVALELSRLILVKCENIAISPWLFDSYEDSKRKIISEYARSVDEWLPLSGGPDVNLFVAE